MGEVLRVRLLRDAEAPRSDGSPTRFGLQDKKGVMHDGVARGGGLIQFDFEVTIAEAPDRGQPDFGGPFVSGSKGERFVYLAWARLGGGSIMNRIKVRLIDIDWQLLGVAAGKRLEADLRGAATGGGNRPVEWRVVDA